MKHIIKLGIVFILYTFMIFIIDFVMGIGIKDQWDELMKWAKKRT